MAFRLKFTCPWILIAFTAGGGDASDAGQGPRLSSAQSEDSTAEPKKKTKKAPAKVAYKDDTGAEAEVDLDFGAQRKV